MKTLKEISVMDAMKCYQMGKPVYCYDRHISLNHLKDICLSTLTCNDVRYLVTEEVTYLNYDSILKNLFEKLKRLEDNRITNEEKIFDIFAFGDNGKVTMLTVGGGCRVRVGDLNRNFVLEEHIIPLKQDDVISDTSSETSSKFPACKGQTTLTIDSTWTKLSATSSHDFKGYRISD